MRMSHPMQPSYRWNGEAESSWGRVFWKPRAKQKNTSSDIEKTNHTITHTQREKSSSVESREYVQEEKLSLLSREDREQIWSVKHQHHLLKLNTRRLGCLAKLHTVAASNNRDHPTRSLYYCLFVPHTYIFVLRAHPVRGESYNQRNTTGEVATGIC